ncbi:MAG: hypothetical protein ACLRY5_06950 [Zhenhengia sp.]
MENIVRIIMLAAIILLVYKTLIGIALKVAIKYVGVPSPGIKTEFLVSIALFIFFQIIWCASAYEVMFEKDIQHIEGFVILAMIGIISIVWCYYNWDYKSIFTLPKLESKTRRSVKKIIIFSFVAIFTIGYGYMQVVNAVEGVKVDVIYTITNTTIIATMIAIDRVLSQVINIYEK